MKNIEALIEGGGDIAVGPAVDCHNALVMFVRRDSETLNALLKRQDRTIVGCC
jgi:hypothetical protein